jgi:uncharacterized protein YegJ (DUF2314 family)
MNENPKNIHYVCTECIDAKKKKAQENLPPISDFIGKYIKKAFNENGKSVEHMWVKINSVNEKAKTLLGTLDNDPTVIKNIACGDEVIVYINEIEEIQ